MVEDQQQQEVENCGTKWRDIVQKIRYELFGKFLRTISHHAAVHPWWYISGITIVSFGMAITGLLTNFYIDISAYDQWTPIGTYTEQHRDWYNHESNFPIKWRTTMMMVHQVDGNNMATREGLEYAFDAVDVLMGAPDYEKVCGEDNAKDAPCYLRGVTKFWDNNSTLFHKQMQEDPDMDVIATISQEQYPDGSPVEIQREFGNAGVLWDHNIVYAQAYGFLLVIPDSEEAFALEKQFVDGILAFREETLHTGYQAQLYVDRAFGDEFMRALLRDFPLMPLAFIAMSLFTMIALWKNHPVQSRSLLGLGAVTCVFLSILTGFGLMFCLGISFASMNQILPFIMFGIGLDDAFIIINAFVRTDPKEPIVDRIDETIEEIGSSIALTTITSSLAFGLGALSSIPSVQSLCHYAYTTILIIFLYQITFFVALVVLDERRMQANRKNCLPCWFSKLTVTTRDDTITEHSHSGHRHQTQQSEWDDNDDDDDNKPVEVDQTHLADRMMIWYAKKLLHPWVKVAVIAFFSAWFGLCLWSAMQLTQEFEFTEVLPKDSYFSEFVRKSEEFSGGSFFSPFPSAYFRCVDQSNRYIQDQMIQYVDELVTEIDEISEPPKFFWLRDFRDFMDTYANNANGLASLTFNEQLDFFLDIPIFHQLYNHEIVRDERTGDIITSSVMLWVDNVNQEDVQGVVDTLGKQRQVTMNQHINTVEGLSDRIVNAPYCENTDETFFAFFLFHVQFQNWEFFSVAVYELVLSSITGIIAVTIVGMLLVPHWTAGLFVLPLICILYVDVLGILQFAGLHINAVTYVSMVMSIGLMVDFIMHVMLRYFECESHLSRHEKVIETLGTMGASVFLGGTSSLLGVLPLWATTSEIIQTIFKAFITLVVVGLSHGLIFLPVVLSIIGPLNTLPSTSLSPRGDVVAGADFEDDDLEKPHRQPQVQRQQQLQQQQEQQQEEELKHQQEVEEFNQQQLEEHLRRRQQAEQLRQQQEEEPRIRQQQLEEPRIRQQQLEAQLRQQQLEAQLRQQQEEHLRQQQEEEEEEEEQLRQQQEEEEEQLRQQQEEEEHIRRQQEEEHIRRQQHEEHIRRQQQEEEQIRRQQQEEHVRRQLQEEQLRQQQEEEQLRQQQEEEEEKQLKQQQREEQIRRQQREEQLKRQQQQEQLKRQQQQEQLMRERQQAEQLMLQRQQEQLMLQRQQEQLMLQRQQEQLEQQRQQELREQQQQHEMREQQQQQEQQEQHMRQHQEEQLEQRQREEPVKQQQQLEEQLNQQQQMRQLELRHERQLQQLQEQHEQQLLLLQQREQQQHEQQHIAEGNNNAKPSLTIATTKDSLTSIDWDSSWSSCSMVM